MVHYGTMDIVSADDIVLPDASLQESANISHGNEALELHTEDEITYGHKLTGSQSSIEYDNKFGDSRRRGIQSRSKSFLDLEEPSRAKAALFMQRKLEGKGLRSTHGSHGDGICLWPSWDISKGFSSSGESKDKGSDQEKKLQIVFDNSTQAQTGGVTQKLFDSNVTFADLVRVYTSQESSGQNCRLQLGNTLLSTVHASTLVSNYLNTYRYYLDYLRKTCGRGDSQEQLSKAPTPASSLPLFLPLTGMTSVFSDDSKEDPEFLELLKKTTTESIRKLWPHSSKNNLVRKVFLIEAANASKCDEPTSVFEKGNVKSPSNQTCSDTCLGQFSRSTECDSLQFSAPEVTHSNHCEHFSNCHVSFAVGDIPLTFREDSNISTNNPNYAMKFSAESVIVGDGDSANVQSLNSTQMQKGLLKVPSECPSSVSGMYKNAAGEPANQPSCTSGGSSGGGISAWRDIEQQKCGAGDIQMSRPSSLDSLLHQQHQKLSQQQQLQRQILQHQQQLQQQRQQQQLIQQYHQQEQQQRVQSEYVAAAASKGYGYTVAAPADQSRGWVQAMGADTAGLTAAYRGYPSPGQASPGYKTEPSLCLQSCLDPFVTNFQVSSDYYLASVGEPMSSRATHLDPETNGYSETTTHQRTLKASYACLDPSNPMTLTVDPLPDYSNEADAFMTQCDMYGRHSSFSTLPVSFGPSFEEQRNNCPDSRMWVKSSRQACTYSESDNSAKSTEERLRKSSSYDRLRLSQFPLQNQWNDGCRGSVQRPIVKVADNMDDGNTYGSFQRGNAEVGSRRTPNSMGGPGSGQDRWNRGMCCSDSHDGSVGDTGTSSSGAGLRAADKAVGFMSSQPSSASVASEQCTGSSRLFQWKQTTTASNKGSSHFQSSRSPTNMSGFSQHNDGSSVQNLLSGLQLDRDFSWNASSQISPLQSQGSLQSGLISDGGPGKQVESGKGSTMSSEQHHRQMSNNNNASGGMRSNGVEQGSGSGGLFYEASDAKHNPWSVKNRQENPDEQAVSNMNNIGCGPVLSSSMQILNKKILAAQVSLKSHGREAAMGSRGSESDSPTGGKHVEKMHSGSSTPSSLDSQSNENPPGKPPSAHRTYGEAGLTRSPASVSCSQPSMLGQQQGRQSVEHSVFKLSEDLEKTFLEDTPNSTPWHELATRDGLDGDFESDDMNNDKDTYSGKLDGYSASVMMSGDSEVGSIRGSDSSRTYDSHRSGKNVHKTNSVGSQMSGATNQQGAAAVPGPSPPRMILGANSVKQQAAEDKAKAEVEESNRRLRQMLGLTPCKETGNNVHVATGMRIQEMSQQLPPQTPSPGLVTMGPVYSQSGSPGQMPPRMQMSAGGKVQAAPMGLTQQMFCVPNILMPPPSVQSQASSRPSNMIPIQGLVTGVGSGARFPPGMIRVPFVDMSRLVYVHQVPVSMASAVHPSNNNHNNSSSSNPHVNTSNIITINTSDNDFSSGGPAGDKTNRHLRANPAKSKTTFLKMRAGTDEFAVPILGLRSPLDDNVGPRLAKARTNPWDQDLDHDFSNSLMSKTVSVENLPGTCPSASLPDGNFYNPEVGLLFPDMTTVHGGSPSNLDQSAKTYMQWPASADMHPEMLDMLPVRRSLPEECTSGRVCWPEMEFLMSSRDQLQTARRSNKPMGSNKANLISIIPKDNGSEGLLGAKDTRFDKSDNKLA